MINFLPRKLYKGNISIIFVMSFTYFTCYLESPNSKITDNNTGVDQQWISNGAPLNSSQWSGYSQSSIMTKSTAQLLFDYSKPEIPSIVLGLSALFVNAYTNRIYPYIIRRVVDRDEFSKDSRLQFFLHTSSLYLAGAAASWIRTISIGMAADRIALRIRKELFKSYLKKDISYFENESSKSGEFIGLMDKEARVAAQVYTDFLSDGIRAIFSSISGSIILYTISPTLCATALVVIPVLSVGTISIYRYNKKLQDLLKSGEGKVVNFAIERINSVSTIRLNSKELSEQQKYNKLTTFIDSTSNSANFVKGVFLGFVNLATNLSLVVILDVGGCMLQRGEITSGQLTQFAMQSVFVMLGFSGLSSFAGNMRRGLQSATSVFKAINDIPEINQLTYDRSIVTNGEISIDNISFSYPNRPSVSVLKNITLVIPPKSTVAFVGGSGSGKTTILHLLSGLYKPSEGFILIDGLDISRVDLYRCIGVVEQDGKLLSGTIYENISYGKENSSKEDVLEAARSACAHEFISLFPRGYETEIGENGCLLSGGQRLRIALARALIKKPKVLLLDEVTSMLDAETEEQICSALNRLKGEMTIIVLTHSKMLMSLAQRIYTIRDGNVSFKVTEDSDH